MKENSSQFNFYLYLYPNINKKVKIMIHTPKKIIGLCCLATCLFVLYPQVAASQNRTVQLFAHRGGAFEFDENTMSAFEGSYNSGLRGFETDVRITKDGVLVIFHDASLERMTGKKGSIEEMTWAELSSVRTKKGNPIPTVDEVIDFFADKTGIYLEFEMKTDEKNYPREKLEKYCDQLYEKVTAKKPASSTYLFTSFDKRPLRYIKASYPDADMLFITPKPCCDETVRETLDLGINRLGCTLDGTSRASVKAAHAAGVFVSCYPGRSLEDFQLGVALGCDFLCSDIPVQVKQWVDKWSNSDVLNVTVK